MTERAGGGGRSRGRRLAGVAAGAVVAGGAMIALSSRFSGESVRAFLLRRLYLPLAGYKRGMRDAEAFARSIPSKRTVGEAPPPDRFHREFQVSSETIAGATVFFVAPRGRSPDRDVVYIHGGAYVGHMQARQWSIVGALVRRTGARVAVPFYPLAPEASWRDGYAMIAALYERLLRDRPADRMTLTGDSAGAGLAVGFAQDLRDRGGALPGGLVLFSPWLDLRRDNPAQEVLDARDPILARSGLNFGAGAWAAGTPLDDPHVSPVLGSLTGLPPMLVFSGTADMLNADARLLVARAREHGARLKYVEGRNMTHAWAISPIPEAEMLYDQAAAFILRR